MTPPSDLQALSDAATPMSEEELTRVRVMLRSGPPPHFTDGVVVRLLATIETLRAATPVVPAEGLREMYAGKIIDAARRLMGEFGRATLDTDTIIELRTVLREYAALAASPSPDTDRERYPAVLQIDGGIGGALIVGTDYRVAEIRGHIEPSGVEGELGHETTVIRFDPVPSPDTDAGLDVARQQRSGERLAAAIQEADETNPEWAKGARFVLGWTKGPADSALEVAFRAVRDLR